MGIQDDRRFNALGSAGERKQVFAEYLTQSKKREMEREREKRKRAQDDMIEALKEWKDLKPASRYRDLPRHFSRRTGLSSWMRRSETITSKTSWMNTRKKRRKIGE